MATQTAEILSWKFPNTPGISTVNGVITEWPADIGPKPTKSQMKAWTIEYEAIKFAEPTKEVTFLAATNSERVLILARLMGLQV